MMQVTGENSGRGTPRLAIRRNGCDIARLMLGSMENGKLDVKISFLGHPFEVYTYPLLHINPDILIPETSEGKNITYHHGKNDKDVVIHLKNELAEDGEPMYKSLPLHRILPPNVNSIMPLPLMKLELPKVIASACDKAKKRKKKPGKRVINIDADCNVVEIFMTSRSWDFNNMQAMIPDLLGLLLVTPFEAWSSNNIIVNRSKLATIPHNDAAIRLITTRFNDVDLFILQYPQPFVSLPGVIRATFIENELAEPLMLHMQTLLANDGKYCYTRCSKLDEILMPDFVRVQNKNCNDAWVRALRIGAVTQQQYDSLSRRIDAERLSLIKEIRKREEELKLAIAKACEVLDELDDMSIALAKDSFERHRVIAKRIGVLPSIIHSTRILNENLGIDENYSFLTIGNDIDIHFDLDDLCELAGVPFKAKAMKTEGWPFTDGLVGLRTHLKLMGYCCASTVTSVLLESDMSEELPIVVPLYKMDGIGKSPA